jgi:transmembrane sensor
MLSDQAVAWLVRLQSDSVTDTDRIGFAAWHASSEAHRLAYTEAQTFVRRLHSPAQEIWNARSTEDAAGTTSQVRVWISAVAASVLLIAAVLVLWNAYPLRSSDIITTEKGQHREVRLADGSTVILNSNTSLRVAFSEQQRRIELQQGEAFFVVAKDALRPFEVSAGNGLTRAIGTEFNIRIREATGTVTVVEGIVQVSQQGSPPDLAGSIPAQSVYRHQTISYSREQGLGHVITSDPVASLAWRRGQLVFNKQPLSQVIEELNQQWNGHIYVAGSRLRQLPVNGVFDLHDIPAVVRAIERTFKVRSITLPFNVVVLY